MNSTEKNFSHHIFLFPFRWDVIPTQNSLQTASYDSRTCLMNPQTEDSFDSILRQNLRWKHTPFSTEYSYLEYNQYQYFYEFVRNALFDRVDSSSTYKSIIRTYSFLEGQSMRYIITIKQSGKAVEYSLKIDKIQLNSYDVGIGILSFHLSTDLQTQENGVEVSPEDVLLINEFGRRLYPQFLGEGYNIEKTYEAFLAKNLRITLDDTILFESDFNQSFSESPDYLPAHILALLGDNQFTHSVSESDKFEKSKINIQALVDDRMFVLSILGCDTEINKLKGYSKEIPYSEDFDFWQKYVFIDGRYVTAPDAFFAQKLLSKATYTRWLPYSTLYGVSRYSFVTLSGANDFARTVLKPHLSTIYFQMIQLALLQRATILRFSSEVKRITLKIDSYENDSLDFEEIHSETRVLYKNYIEFRNQLYFREITAQEQGVELYDMVQQTLRVELHIKELDAEIEELHRYINMVADDKMGERQEVESENINRITKIGGIFGFVSILLSFFGYGLIDFPKGKLSVIGTFGVFCSILLVLGLTFYLYFPKEIRNIRKQPFSPMKYLAILAALAIVVFPFFLQHEEASDVTKVDSLLLTNQKKLIFQLDSVKLELQKIKKLNNSDTTTLNHK